MKIYNGKEIAELSKVKYWKIAEFFKGVRGLKKDEVKAIKKVVEKQHKDILKALDDCE